MIKDSSLVSEKKNERHLYGPFKDTIFRNDDVAYDSNLDCFRKICDIFHKYGYCQLHGIILFGRMNCSYIVNGIPAMYDSIDPYDIYNYDICRSVSSNYFIGDNKALVDYINSIPDPIALHGLFHSDYSQMSYEQQEADIKEGLRLMHMLFPHKSIDTFIAPFNHSNQDTTRICDKYGLRISAQEGEHLEEMVDRNRGIIMPGQVYRYHHHRFNPESTFFYYDLNLDKLDHYLQYHRLERPKICLLCDVPNWAFHNSAIEIKKNLSEEFDFDIKYAKDEPKINPNNYDLLYIFFWGDQKYKKWGFPYTKVIKKVSSHRWESDLRYGPCTPAEFVEKYLNDIFAVICPSKILYKKLQPYIGNLYLCGDGYSPKKFFFKNKRTGPVSLCMAGNLNDPIKGVHDILIPSAKGYQLDLADSLPHEDLCEFYNQHDLYVVSSQSESNPLPLIESMACGCFPISSRIGIAPEIIRHQENGYLVKERTPEAFADAYDWCSENIDYIRSRAYENAMEMYNNRRWEIKAENYRKVFRKIMERQWETN